MAEFDALPAELRRWLHTAALPWSPRSARRAWARARRAAGGDPEQVFARLDALEANTLSRDRFAAGSINAPGGS